MNRTRRAVAAFLLAMAVALPVAALPAAERAQPWGGVFAALWAHIAPVLGLAEKSRASADPNGVTVPVAPPPAEEDSNQQSDGDSRSGMDPDG
jgi:hypothetical protein